MSWHKPVIDEGEIVEYQIGFDAVGNQATDSRLLSITGHTDGIHSIELLELGYLPAGETALDSTLPVLRWANGDLSNNSGGRERALILLTLPNGIYYNEYNVPVNLYTHSGVKHRIGCQTFNLQIVKRDGSLMNTSLVRMRLRVSYYKADRMHYEGFSMHTVLNAP